MKKKKVTPATKEDFDALEAKIVTLIDNLWDEVNDLKPKPKTRKPWWSKESITFEVRTYWYQRVLYMTTNWFSYLFFGKIKL